MESNGTPTCTRWGSMESNGTTTRTGWWGGVDGVQRHHHLYQVGVDGIQRHHHLYRVGGRWNATAPPLVPGGGWMESNGITTCTVSGVDEIQRHHYSYRLVGGGGGRWSPTAPPLVPGGGRWNPTESPLVPGVGSMECNGTTTCTEWGVYGIQRHHHSYQVGGPCNPKAPPLVPGGVSMESNGTTTCTRWGSVESNGTTTRTRSGVHAIQRHHHSYQVECRWSPTAPPLVPGGGRWNPTASPLLPGRGSMKSKGTTTRTGCVCGGGGVDGVQRHHHLYQVGVDGIQQNHHLYRVWGRWNETAPPLVACGGWMESNGITTCTGSGVDEIQRHH